MKLQHLRESYLAYVVPDQARNDLAREFQPKYPEFVGHHIIQQFGVPLNTQNPGNSAQITVIGHAEEDGLEALVVTVNGAKRREDGRLYHITWSLDRSKGKKPVMSNDLVQRGYTPVEPYTFNAPLKLFS